jgi:putative FmdB family regulatory protein
MPLYELYCPNCGNQREVLCTYENLVNELTACSTCDTKLERKICKTNFVLEGGCWAKDGYHSSLANTVCKDENGWIRE